MEAPVILHEETNYARLNLAIRTTCAICLEDVLQKNVPRGFKDIYHAVSCKRNQLKKQITIQHFDQLFPLNSPSPAFTVSNCDIPLLYSLIRNVSSVPPPITGWGKPVIDQPRDTSVGANVERLRDCRNHIIHLQEPKVSDHDFNKLWEEVRHSIVDIEVVLGGYKHQEKLESLKTADMDPNFVNREISNVKRVVQEILENQNRNQDYILELQQDQVMHGSILNNIARTQTEHDDILDVLKGGQGNNVTALCNIQALLNNNQVASEEIKKQIAFHSQSLEQGLERLEIKLDQVLDFQGKEHLKDRKIETHDDQKVKEWNNPNKVLYELQKRNGNQRQCLEESTIKQGCKGQTVIIQDSIQGQDSSEDMSVTDDTQPHETVEKSSSPNWTVEEIVMVWPSIETLLLDDLFPKLVISFFEKGNVFSKHECDTIRQTAGRRTMTKELLNRIKDRLPQSFDALFHALNETDQQDIAKELKTIIERGPIKEAPVSNSHCFTVKAKVIQNGQTLQTVEFQVNTHVNKKVLISLPLTFEIVGSEMGSVIIHLRASGRNSYDAMVAFCKHGGMKNFILNLLKEKEVFNSLPAGEISIEIQVRQDEEDLNYEGVEENKDDLAHMTENMCSLSCPAIHAADKSHVIKENLILQYECVADEIDPLQFAETFVNRGILDESFFKDLKNYRRGRRAVLFLNEVLEKGKEALCALTEGLKNMGCEDLVAKLCFENRRSKQQWNNGNLDGDLVKVELEVPDKYFGEDLMWSCRLKCAVEKNIHDFPNTLTIDDMTYMKRMDTSEEETMQFSFEALFEIIVDRVDYQHLMAFLPIDMLSPVQRKEVFNIKQRDGPSAATRRILEIIKAQERSGKYRALVDALQRNYPSLVRALTCYKRQYFNMGSRENLVKLFSSSIAERMSVQQVLPYLLQSSVIVQLEKEMLESELQNYGNIRAAKLLFLYLPVHVENWYIEFLKALCHSEQTELAKFIDQSFVQKYCVKTDIIPKRTDVGAWGKNMIGENSSEMSLTPEKYMDYDYFNTRRSIEEQKLDETGLKKGPIGHPPDTPQKSAINNAARWVMDSKFQVEDEGLLETKSVLESKPEEYTDLAITMDSIVSRFREKRSLDPDDESSDSAYMSESEDAEEEEYISLRMYQEELARPALQGRNVIILAPTGSGKSFVAYRIIQGHFRHMKHQGANGLAVLVVKNVILAHQLGQLYKDLLPAYRTQVIAGETKMNQTISIGERLKRCEILVLTAQHFLYNLMNGTIKSIAHISLMIFDECHHCKDNHPYNTIMQYYMDLKLTSATCMSPLPQIIGLASSLDIGEAVDVPQAKENIIKLMANLDAELINTVTENVDELRQHVHMPPISEIDTIISVSPRANDDFSVSITKIMNTIENMMRNAEVVKKVTIPNDYIHVLNAPSEKGSEPYIQWLSEMWMITTTVHYPEVRRFIRPCFMHLQWYNQALIIYNDARVKDAVDFLKEKMDDWKERSNMDANEQCLLMLYSAGTQPKYVQEVPNPKLNALKRLILNSFSERSVEESRCIVFVKTRVLAGALVSWMTDTPELKVLSPTVFVGINVAKDTEGITRFQQSDKLAEFRKGRYKIMVATSVAEEGLDIQQCNLVIRYDHVTHEIATVQSRGRAITKSRKYVAQDEKEEINTIQETLVQRAVIELQLDIQQNIQKFKSDLRVLQDKHKFHCNLQAKQMREMQKKQGEYELRCIQCNDFICMSSDIRKIQNVHNIVINPTLRDRISFTKNLFPSFQDDEIEFSGKIFCSNCHEDFGRVCIYRHNEYPVIKIEKFIIVNERGIQITCKKWKQVPFEVPNLTIDDQKMLLDIADFE